MTRPPVVRVDAVRKTYGRTVAVDEVSFDVQPGEIFGLIGPNGAGKTTTMECVEGLRTPDRGAITVLGLNPARDIYALQERIGVQLQEAQLQKRIKVREAVGLWAALYRKPLDGDRLIEQLGLSENLIAASAVLSLVAIIAIYREGGILKRLRATPLRPYTILTAHVIVKLLFTAITLAAMVLAGRRYYPVDADVPLVSFTLALLFTTICILSLGFVIASVVPTARFAQPIGSLILYPMLGLSGLFVPLDSLPPMLQAAARTLPLTYAVSLLRGIWQGDSWAGHLGDVAALALMFLVCTAVSARVFRWE